MGDSGLGTERTHRTGLARASWVPDNLRAKGDCGGWTLPLPDPGRMTGPNATVGTVFPDPGNAAIGVINPEYNRTSVVRSCHQSRWRPGSGYYGPVSQCIRDRKNGSADPAEPRTSTSPVPRRSVRFTNTAVPKFDGTVCWHQHQQVFNAIAKSNGWDEEQVRCS